jgi:PAS domain S-box-containing protein
MYRELIDFLPISLFETDVTGKIISGNPVALETFGYRYNDLEKGIDATRMIIPEQKKRLVMNIQKVLHGEKMSGSEYTGVRKDGSTFPLIVFSSPIIRGGNPVGLSGAIIDLTDRKRIEESLKKSNLSLAEAQRIAHIGNWELDIERNDMYWSDELYRIVGTTPQMFDGTYETFLKLLFPKEREIIEKAVEKATIEGATSEIEHLIVRYDEAVRDVRQMVEPIIDERGKIVRIIGIVQDVTEKNQVERDLQNARDQLLQSEKLAAMGRLSAGVAHEILNPVNIISMELQILQTMESLSPEVLEELTVCMTQINRIVTIAENLKQFSRIPEKKTGLADINTVIAHVLTLYTTQLKIEGIETEVQYHTDLPAIAMDKEKIEQVILNLITNAVASMEGKERKELRITTGKESIFGNHDHLKIMIADTGTGIKSEHLSKIFDPFFTTKGQGKGTGLGLSISYGIIHDHGGRIWAENNEWGGVSFYIRLPVKTNVKKIITEMRG